MRRPAKGQRILFISEQKQKAHRLPNVWHPDKGRADCSLFYTSLSFPKFVQSNDYFREYANETRKVFQLYLFFYFCHYDGTPLPSLWQSSANALAEFCQGVGKGWHT